MKRIWIICLMLMMFVSCAFAENDIHTPRAGFAVAAPDHPEDGGTVNLYAAADGSADVMMRYYSGARVEVLGFTADGAYAHVSSGAPGATITGYILTDELAYGEAAAREVPICYEALQFLNAAPVYSYCDARGAVIGATQPTRFYAVCGKNEGGMGQIFDPSGTADADCGFVNVNVPMLYRNFESDPHTISVPPLAGELTREEAYERAIACLLDGSADTHGFFDRLPQHLRSEEGLRSMDADIRLWMQDGVVLWHIMLTDPENLDNNVSVSLTPAGEPHEVSRANG